MGGLGHTYSLRLGPPSQAPSAPPPYPAMHQKPTAERRQPAEAGRVKRPSLCTLVVTTPLAGACLRRHSVGKHRRRSRLAGRRAFRVIAFTGRITRGWVIRDRAIGMIPGRLPGAGRLPVLRADLLRENQSAPTRGGASRPAALARETASPPAARLTTRWWSRRRAPGGVAAGGAPAGGVAAPGPAPVPDV